MMEELTAQKVNKWLFWTMLAIFGIITYMNFYQFVHRALIFAFSLPLWFMIAAGVLGAFFILNLISRGQHALEDLEDELRSERQGIAALERSFRLARQDPASLTPASFRRYCADVLRHLGYQRLESAPMDLKGVQFYLFTPTEDLVFVACAPSTTLDLRGALHQLYYQMLQKGVRQGMLLTAGTVDAALENWANSLDIRCLNAQQATLLAKSFLENA